MCYTVIYPAKRTYEKFDNEHYMLYLGEKSAKYTPAGVMEASEDQEPVKPVNGFSYTGDQEDGGTLIKAGEATYDAFVSGLIRKRYSADEVEAIQSNMIIALKNPESERTADFNQDWEEFQAYRAECKTLAKTVLNI